MAKNKTYLAPLRKGRFRVEGLLRKLGCSDFELPRAEALLERALSLRHYLCHSPQSSLPHQHLGGRIERVTLRCRGLPF